MTSKDINNGGGINPFLNTAHSLFLKKNYLNFMNQDTLLQVFRLRLVNGLSLELSANYEDRRILRIHTNFSFFKSSKSIF